MRRGAILARSPGRSALLAAVAVALAACSRDAPSILDPRGPTPARVAGLFWVLLAISAFVVAVVSALLVLGVLPGRRRREPRPGTPTWSKVLVAGGGVVFPLVALTAVWVLTLRDLAAVSEPGEPYALTVEVTGYQWWWEVEYRELGIRTANEVHVPTGRPVRVRLHGGDVIHSFWVPQVLGKMDVIPGRVNETWMQADRPGVYRGQCAEYCGLQHTYMALHVVALRPVEFERWADAARLPAREPTTDAQREGREAFLSSACSACHSIEGVSEHPDVGRTYRFPDGTPFTAVHGPDLTHFGSRISIGAGAAPNTRGNLGGWIVDSQTVKPGNRMPPMQLEPDALNDLIEYLESLR